MSIDMSATRELAEKTAVAQRTFDDRKAEADLRHAAYQEAYKAQAAAGAALQALLDLQFYDKIAYQEQMAKAISAPSPRFPADASGRLTAEALRDACSRVWRDANSERLLGPFGGIPVRSNDGAAMIALTRHFNAVSGREGMAALQLISDGQTQNYQIRD